MRFAESRPAAFPVALAGVLILSIAVAWSYAYWTVAVAICATSLLGLAWALMSSGFHADAASVPAYVSAVLMGAWGTAQLAAGTAVAPWLTGRASPAPTDFRHGQTWHRSAPRLQHRDR